MFEIFSSTGQLVKEGSGVIIDVSGLASGSYLIVAYPQDEEMKGSYGRAIFIKE